MTRDKRKPDRASVFTSEVQAVFDRFAYYIPHFPELTPISGNPVFSIVFSRLVWHDDRRIRRNAEFFQGTDHQLAEECGIGVKQFIAARDLICAPGIALFTKEVHGVPPINHYRANYARIHAWLSANGIKGDPPNGPPGDSSGVNLPKNGKSIYPISANQFTGNRQPLKKEDENIDDDDACQQAAHRPEENPQRAAIVEELTRWGIEGPTREVLADVYSTRPHGLEDISAECRRNCDLWAGQAAAVQRGEHRETIIKRPAGLTISNLCTKARINLRDEIKRRAGK